MTLLNLAQHFTWNVVCCTLIGHNCIFPTKLLSVVSIVISECLNITLASRHCIIYLCFTHHFSNSYDITIMMTVRSRRLCCEYTHKSGGNAQRHIVHLYSEVVRTRKYIYEVCFLLAHSWMGLFGVFFFFFLVSYVSNVVSRSTSVRSVDKQHFVFVFVFLITLKAITLD